MTDSKLIDVLRRAANQIEVLSDVANSHGVQTNMEATVNDLRSLANQLELEQEQQHAR
jgi:hypothetical protein